MRLQHLRGDLGATVDGERSAHQTSRSLVLLVACLAQFMVVVDSTVVNVALPSIQRRLGFSSGNLQWVVDAYTLMLAQCSGPQGLLEAQRFRVLSRIRPVHAARASKSASSCSNASSASIACAAIRQSISLRTVRPWRRQAL